MPQRVSGIAIWRSRAGMNRGLYSPAMTDTPLQPAHLDLLFSPGMRLVVAASPPMEGVGGTVVVEVQEAGTLKMPSGGLIACDPTYLNAGERGTPDAYQEAHQPFTATVAPGEYPVLLSRFRWIEGRRAG